MTAQDINVLPSLEDKVEIKGRSLWSDAMQRLMMNKAAITRLIILGTLTIMVIVPPVFSPFTFDEIDWDLISTPPSWTNGHIFGTDAIGRDLFVRTLYGGRMSLMIGIIATLVSLIIGVSYGATAGYLGGKTDAIMMRIVPAAWAHKETRPKFRP